MASSPIPEIVILKAPQGVHLALAWGIPAAAVQVLVFWVTGQGPSAASLPGTVYALAMIFWATWKTRTHQGPALKLWFWAVGTLALYGILALAYGPPWPDTFGLWGPHLFWFLVGLVQGFLGSLWAGQLAPRARLFQLIEGCPEGKALEERVREFQADADFSRSNHVNLGASLVFLGTLAVVLAAWSPYGRDGVSAVLLAAFLGLCALTGVLLRTYRREMTALMYGRRFSLGDKAAPLAWSLLLAAGAGLAAWGLTALSGPWIDWSQVLDLKKPSLPPTLVPQAPVPPPDRVLTPENLRWAVLLSLLWEIFRFGVLISLLTFLLQAVVWLAPWALGAALVWPLVRWVLSGGRSTKGLLRRWRRLLAAQLRTFLGVLATWGRRTSAAVLGTSPTAGGAREWLRSFLVRPAPGRRRPYPEVVEAFLALVRWAEPLTSYRQGETTREFLDRLAALVPEKAPGLESVRDLLDAELFGSQGLDEASRLRFRHLVAGLTAGPASHDPPAGVS